MRFCHGVFRFSTKWGKGHTRFGIVHRQDNPDQGTAQMEEGTLQE